MARSFETGEALAKAGCSYRQLDYWCRCRYVRPSMNRYTARQWDESEVAALRLLSVMAGREFTGKAIPWSTFEALHLLRSLDDWAGKVLVIRQPESFVLDITDIAAWLDSPPSLGSFMLVDLDTVLAGILDSDTPLPLR